MPSRPGREHSASRLGKVKAAYCLSPAVRTSHAHLKVQGVRAHAPKGKKSAFTVFVQTLNEAHRVKIAKNKNKITLFML